MSAGLHFVLTLKKSGEVGAGARFQRIVIRRLTECLLAHVGDERHAIIECAANPAITALFWLKTLRLRFTIDDWTMVPVIAATAGRQVLQISDLELHDEDGQETLGLSGSVDNKPVIGVTANPHLDALFVRIGGFERAAVSRSGRDRLVVVFTSRRKQVS